MNVRYPILGLSFSAIVLLAAYFVPVFSQQDVLVRLDHAKQSVFLNPGDTLTQSFRPNQPYITKVTVSADIDALYDRDVTLTISDHHNAIIHRGKAIPSAYAEGGNILSLSTGKIYKKVDATQPLTLSISLTSGPPLPVRIAMLNYHKEGVAKLHNQEQAGDIALTVHYPVLATPQILRGVQAASIFFFLVTLLPFIPKRYRWHASALLLVLITPFTMLGFWFSPGELGMSDWDYYFSYHETIRKTIIEYHQFPLWNPWICGGTSFLSDPEFPLFTPTFLLELIFGIPTGFRLAIYLVIATTAVGMLVLAKKLKFSLNAALLVALAGAFGSVSLLEIVEGHPNVMASMWLPWIFWAWLTAYRQRASKQSATTMTIVTGIFLALAFFQGGIYLLSYTTLAFIVMICLAKFSKSAFFTTLWAGLWAIGLASIKLIPALLWLRHFPDASYASSGYTLSWIFDILIGRHLYGLYLIPFQNSGWHEYGAYISLTAFSLAIIGLIAYRTQRLVLGLGLATLIAILVSTSGPGLEPIFDLIPFIPRSNISRVIIYAVIPLSLLAGYGITFVEKHTRTKSLSFLLLAIASLELFTLSSQLSYQAFTLPSLPPLEPAPYPIAFTRERFDNDGQDTRTTRAYVATKAGYGTFTYCSVLGPPPLVRTIHDEEDNASYSVYPKKEFSNSELISWQPDEVVIKTNASQPVEVVINTNEAPGWTVNGQIASGNGGRVGTPGYITPGEHILTFKYRPQGMYIGLVITLITIGLIIWRLKQLARVK